MAAAPAARRRLTQEIDLPQRRARGSLARSKPIGAAIDATVTAKRPAGESDERIPPPGEVMDVVRGRPDPGDAPPREPPRLPCVAGEVVQYQLFVPDGAAGAQAEPGRGGADARPRFRKAAACEPCRFKALCPTSISADPAVASWVIAEWYRSRLESGGEPSPIAEHVLRKLASPDARRPASGALPESRRVCPGLPAGRQAPDQADRGNAGKGDGGQGRN